MSRRKVLFVCTEDWFFRSHFLPLGRAVIETGDYEAALATTISDAQEVLEGLGLEVHPVDFKRSSRNPLAAVKLLTRLIRLIRRERPDIVHFIAMKPVLLGGLATVFTPKAAKVYHVTGLGSLADGKSIGAALVRYMCFRLVASYLKRRNSWLVAENPDDLNFLEQYGVPVDTSASLVGGAGVDPEFYAALPIGGHKPLRAAYIGRMIGSKGVDVLIAAKDQLRERGVELELEMFGAPDPGNPGAIDRDRLMEWSTRPGVKWHGVSSDVRDVWRNCDIAVIPTRTREGMPRAMLEAASCGRPLIVTDVPGCRHFVRDGVEGLIVPPNDPTALARALEKLAGDPELRARMGSAARERIVGGFTESHMCETFLRIYAKLVEALGIDT